MLLAQLSTFALTANFFWLFCKIGHYEAIRELLVERGSKYRPKIAFNGGAKTFCRTYNFLAALLPMGEPMRERLSHFFRLLVPKLPSPDDPDLAKGVLDRVDLEAVPHEGECGRGFVDIALKPQLSRYPEISFAAQIELKYFRATDEVTPATLAQVKADALEQIERYARDRNIAREWNLKPSGTDPCCEMKR